MTITAALFPVAECFRQDGVMQDWTRLGRYVVARRVELGFKQRADFASALQVSVRVLSDIENGRRGNFDAVTIAKLEQALGWETGSVGRIVEGGEPQLRVVFTEGPSDAALLESLARTTKTAPVDEIEMIYNSTSMTARQKLEAIRMVLRLRAQAEQEAAHAGQHQGEPGDVSRAPR